MKEEEIKEKLEDEGKKLPQVTPLTRDIAKMIFLHYKLRDVENMFFVGVVNYLRKNLAENSLVEIAEQVKLIERICPDWLFEVQNRAGKILRINKSLRLEEVLAVLK